MIPFTIPLNHEIINVSQIVRMSEMDNGTIDVHYANGETISYSGQAAEIIKGEVMFSLNNYYELKRQMMSNIVKPDSNSLIM
jgi:hypothetical protein